MKQFCFVFVCGKLYSQLLNSFERENSICQARIILERNNSGASAGGCTPHLWVKPGAKHHDCITHSITGTSSDQCRNILDGEKIRKTSENFYPWCGNRNDRFFTLLLLTAVVRSASRIRGQNLTHNTGFVLSFSFWNHSDSCREWLKECKFIDTIYIACGLMCL